MDVFGLSRKAVYEALRKNKEEETRLKRLSGVV
jgi:hypothetical protein